MVNSTFLRLTHIFLNKTFFGSATYKEILIVIILSCCDLVQANLFDVRGQEILKFHHVTYRFRFAFIQVRIFTRIFLSLALSLSLSLPLIVHIYTIKHAVRFAQYYWCLIKCVNEFLQIQCINRIIYLYTHNTVQIHNNINIFNIGPIKTGLLIAITKIFM